ncbi:MAG: glutamine-hydrolyzing carbamoyl-phosphate synthase small subunit [Thermomonas sp.]
MPVLPPAVLALADGTTFLGHSIGAAGRTTGEVVFNTALTGYQEILTDPSYARQIVTLTYPHIGNTGVNGEDVEASRVHAAGLVVRDLPLRHSNFRATATLAAYLAREGTVAIAGIDTRRLTRVLRTTGAQNGCIQTFEAGAAVGPDQLAAAVAAARAAPTMVGQDLARAVTTDRRYEWATTEWRLGHGYGRQEAPRFRVVAVDFGVKHNILRMLARRGCHLTVVPATTSAADLQALDPDGVFLSNGPGDPAPCDYAIEAIREFIRAKIPLYGICLGHQLLGLAVGAQTMKMPHGHHGANHPVQDLSASDGSGGRVMITSQNHGFCIDEATLPANVRVTHRSLFDGTNQGIELTDAPAFSFQGHPEAAPGPHDVAPLFDKFIALMERNANA